jgi:hypothetical protein
MLVLNEEFDHQSRELLINSRGCRKSGRLR